MHSLIKYLLFCVAFIWAIALWLGLPFIDILLYGERIEVSVDWTTIKSCDQIKEISLNTPLQSQKIPLMPSFQLCQEKPAKLFVWLKKTQEDQREVICVDRLEEHVIRAFNILVISSFFMVFFTALYALTYQKHKKHKHHDHIAKKIGFFDLDAQDDEEERREAREENDDRIF
jgi:hypothetical protein